MRQDIRTQQMQQSLAFQYHTSADVDVGGAATSLVSSDRTTSSGWDSASSSSTSLCFFFFFFSSLLLWKIKTNITTTERFLFCVFSVFWQTSHLPVLFLVLLLLFLVFTALLLGLLRDGITVSVLRRALEHLGTVGPDRELLAVCERSGKRMRERLDKVIEKSGEPADAHDGAGKGFGWHETRKACSQQDGTVKYLCALSTPQTQAWCEKASQHKYRGDKIKTCARVFKDGSWATQYFHSQD